MGSRKLSALLMLFVCVVFTSLSVSAGEIRKEIVTLANGEKTYVKVATAEGQRPTFLFINGLIYNLEKWEPMLNELSKQGYGIVLYSLYGQPENLRLLPEGEEPFFFRKGLSLDDLTQQARMVLEALKIGHPVNLVGLSYGSAIAAEFATKYPQLVQTTIFAAPLVVPLDNYDSTGRSLRNWLDTVRYWENASCTMYGMWNPIFCARDDYWFNTFFDGIYGNYVNYRIKTTPPGVDPTLFKKSVFHLVRAARDFNLHRYVSQIRDVHMILASEDVEALLKDQHKIWQELPKAEKRSLVTLQGVPHTIPDASPMAAASWLGRIGADNKDLTKGEEFSIDGDSTTGAATLVPPGEHAERTPSPTGTAIPRATFGGEGAEPGTFPL